MRLKVEGDNKSLHKKKAHQNTQKPEFHWHEKPKRLEKRHTQKNNNRAELILSIISSICVHSVFQFKMHKRARDAPDPRFVWERNLL